jgi:hypothetical protein
MSWSSPRCRQGTLSGMPRALMLPRRFKHDECHCEVLDALSYAAGPMY